MKRDKFIQKPRREVDWKRDYWPRKKTRSELALEFNSRRIRCYDDYGNISYMTQGELMEQMGDDDDLEKVSLGKRTR